MDNVTFATMKMMQEADEAMAHMQAAVRGRTPSDITIEDEDSVEMAHTDGLRVASISKGGVHFFEGYVLSEDKANRPEVIYRPNTDTLLRVVYRK